MTRGRIAILLIVLSAGLTVGRPEAALAQMMPMGPQGAPMGSPMGPPPGAPPCMGDFVPLRTAAEKRAAAIKAGSERHAGAQEMCQLFNQFMEAESKVVKFLETNASWCGIPPQIITTMKTNHTKTAETKQKICSAATLAGPSGERRGGGLGEALGMRTLPTPDPNTDGKGTLDTLSGNPLVK